MGKAGGYRKDLSILMIQRQWDPVWLETQTDLALYVSISCLVFLSPSRHIFKSHKVNWQSYT